MKFYTRTAGGLEITAAYSGVCKVNAAIAAQVFIDSFRVDGIINAGVAGGIDPSVQLFDTIVADRVLYHDVAEDTLTDFHPWLKENCFRADPRLLAAARAYSMTAEQPVLFGTMATGEQFIVEEKREEILQKFAPLCVDMETAAL